MSNKKIPLYLIPGLSTDGRIFEKLTLNQPFEIIEWKTVHKGDSLQDYAARMAATISIEQPIKMIGLSFGGIMAQEIARIRRVKRIAIISSLKAGQALPFNFRLFRYVPLYHLSRGSWRIKTFPYWAPRFGISDPTEIALLQDMFSAFDDSYRMWSIRNICHWKSVLPDCPLLHIHGSKDKVFPLKYVQPDIGIQGGNHFMIYQKAGEISQILNQWLSEG